MLVPGQLSKLLNKYMYYDKVTVYRQIDTVDDEGADDYSVKEIYIDIPCKLSQDTKAFTTQSTDRQVDIKTDLKLFLSQEYDILPNDILEITHNGQKFLLNAIKAFKYKSHQELLVNRKDEV